jgi:hypothetical protein
MLYLATPLQSSLSNLAAFTMHKRFLATSVLATALLFSQGSSFLIAALCPHLRSGMALCEMQQSAPTMSHEDMGHEDMGDMQMGQEPASQANANVAALDQPIIPCSHCAVHSRTTLNVASLKQAEAAKRSVDLDVPFQDSRVAPDAASPVQVLASRAHGPPGEPSPRYILINIFRI